MDDLLKNAIGEFEYEYGILPQYCSFAPARVNLIGGHTDYNKGFALPIAIRQRVYTLLALRKDGKVKAKSLQVGSPVEFSLGDQKLNNRWDDSVKGVLALLQKEGGDFSGMDILFTGDAPLEAGLSSSAAFTVSALMTVSQVMGQEYSPKEISLLAQRVENEFMGVSCGILDQMASAAGKEAHALLLDCRDLTYRHIRIEGDFSIVVCHTGVTRSLASSKYNERREQCDRGLALIMKKDSEIMSLRDVTFEALLRYEKELGSTLFARLKHVVCENQRVIDACQALEGGNVDRLGELIYMSHRSLRDDYEVSCAELDAMVELSLEEPGCHGGRLVGAGFGGCSIAIVDKSSISPFCEKMKKKYKSRTGNNGLFIPVQAGPGASPVLLST